MPRWHSTIWWKEIAMTRSKRALALASAAAVAITAASPSFAGPILSGPAGVKAAASDNVVDVRWRRGGGVAAGFAVGALAGAAIGAAAAGPGYYGYGYPAYGYGYGYYPAYSYGPYPAYGYRYGAYPAYAYPGQTCGFYGGYGRWDYSQC